MKHWSKGNMLNNNNEETTTKINCTIIYDDKVIQPRKTSIEYQLNPRQQQQTNTSAIISQIITITLEENEQTLVSRMFSEKNRTLSSSTTSNMSSNTATAIALISSNLQFQNKINSPCNLAVSSNMSSSSSLLGESTHPYISTPPINHFNGVGNAWTKRTLENVVVIPENNNVKSNFKF